MRHLVVRIAIVATFVASASLAAAEPTAQKRRGEITVEPVNIPGRVPRPLVAVDVARVTTRVAIPQRPFSPVGRIETAARHKPF
jgi:hypothetical protein